MTFDPSVAWPSGSMGMLVEAAFHADAVIASRKWESWKENNPDLDTLDWQTARMLALAATSLSTRGIESTNVSTLNGMRQFDWALGENHLLNVRPLLNALAQAGIATMANKGAALLLSGFHTGATRLMADIDILIHPAQIDNVLDVAESLGWIIKRRFSRATFTDRLRSSRHSFELTNGGRTEVDLHTFALLLNRCPDHDVMLWARGTRARVGDMDILVPSATDMLVVTLGHGLLYNPRPMAVWVGDAITLIESGTVDWDIFLEEIERRDLTTFAYSGLEYISQVLERPVPGHVRRTLASRLREPFVSEFLGHNTYWEATSRMIRTSWGAAASSRAQKWQSRRNASQGIVPVTPASIAIQTGWQNANQIDASRFSVDIHENIQQISKQCFLEIKLIGHAIQSSEQLSVALACFDNSACELDYVDLPSANPIDGNTGQDQVIQFRIDATTLAAYSLHKLRLELLIPGTMDASEVKLDAVEYRWHTQVLT